MTYLEMREREREKKSCIKVIYLAIKSIIYRFDFIEIGIEWEYWTIIIFHFLI